MKKAISLFLILIMLLHCSFKVAVVAYYHMNKDYIAKFLCENRYVPKKQCNGKCYMNKKLKAQEAQDKKIPALLKEVYDSIYYYTPFVFSADNHQYYSTTVQFSTNNVENHISNFSFSIFHPPRAV